jgi:hypothetical protein
MKIGEGGSFVKIQHFLALAILEINFRLILRMSRVVLDQKK